MDQRQEGATGVLYVRGGVVESVHAVHVAVVDADGRLVGRVGDPGRTTFYRSAAKPIQALPLLEDGAAERFGLTGEEVALCCASHSSEPGHLETVRTLLGRLGLDADALECGPHLPLREEEAHRLLADGVRPGPLHNNCSGKHAGMLALAIHHGWDPGGYIRPDHPVQRRMLEEVARWCDLPPEEITTGTDGCGVVSFAVPLERMALSFARFAREARDPSTAPGRVVEAMVSHPWHVAGTGRLCTALMEAAGDRLFAKTGAEGVYCAGIPGRDLGVALKVEDGARRASDVALVRVLEALEALPPGGGAALAPFRRPPVRNTRGEEVGELRASFEMEGP